MVITLFSRDNVSIKDIDNLSFSDLTYWYDAHLQITKALKKPPPSKK